MTIHSVNSYFQEIFIDDLKLYLFLDKKGNHFLADVNFLIEESKNINIYKQSYKVESKNIFDLLDYNFEFNYKHLESFKKYNPSELLNIINEIILSNDYLTNNLKDIDIIKSYIPYQKINYKNKSLYIYYSAIHGYIISNIKYDIKDLNKDGFYYNFLKLSDNDIIEIFGFEKLNKKYWRDKKGLLKSQLINLFDKDLYIYKHNKLGYIYTEKNYTELCNKYITKSKFKVISQNRYAEFDINFLFKNLISFEKISDKEISSLIPEFNCDLLNYEFNNFKDFYFLEKYIKEDYEGFYFKEECSYDYYYEDDNEEERYYKYDEINHIYQIENSSELMDNCSELNSSEDEFNEDDNYENWK